MRVATKVGGARPHFNADPRAAEMFIAFHFEVPAVARRIRSMIRLPLAFLVLGLSASVARDVDQSYAPATWHTPLGLPDDWHKPMADDRGALLYDFGPGPYAKPLTVVEFGLADTPLTRERQWFESARVPIVRTTLANGNTRVEVTTLAVPPEKTADSNARFARYERLDGISGALGWAQPSTPCSPEFRNVAWGINRPIRYRVRVAPGAKKRVALGYCESYKPRLNERVAAMHVEGAAEQVADLALTAARNTPQVFLFDAADANRDGWLDIAVEAPQGKDPNPALALIAIYAADAKLNRDLLIEGANSASDPAELRIACGTEQTLQAPRIDAMEATFPAGTQPELTVRTGRQLRVEANGALSLGDAPFVTTIPRAEKIEWASDRWHLRFPMGTTHATALVFSGRPDATTPPATFDFANAAADNARAWQKTDVPFGHLAVGDPAIQRIADSALRNVYQARERINGQGQFNSSFTLYRGLWEGDAIYLIELAAMLGDFARARETLDVFFSFQNARGLIDELPPLVIYRTTPGVFWALERYARLSGDWASVERHWPAILRGVQALRAARDETLTKPGAANAGLLPAAFNDGGLADIGSEYSSVYWCLTGLRATARAGRQIGRTDDARAIDRLADEFLAAFEKASARDLRKDAHGNSYLPVRVGAIGPDDLPQLAQWGVIEHHIFGEGLPLDGPLGRGSLAMLAATEVEGLVPSSGWMRDGIWVGFNSLYAHWPLLLGDHAKAADLLYAVANHASPAGGWVEEQSLKNLPPKTAGDQPHCWAATLFVRLAISMLACERAGTLHLCLSTPPEWLRAGMVNQLDTLRTTTGPLSLKLAVSADGHAATLAVTPPPTGVILLHTQSLQAAGFRLVGTAPTPDTLPVKAGDAASWRFVR